MVSPPVDLDVFLGDGQPLLRPAQITQPRREVGQRAGQVGPERVRARTQLARYLGLAWDTSGQPVTRGKLRTALTRVGDDLLDLLTRTGRPLAEIANTLYSDPHRLDRDTDLGRIAARLLAATTATADSAVADTALTATRDDLLDLMSDSTATEYQLVAPSGDWQTDLLALARQARDIMRRHRWLPALVIGRPALGPHGTDLLEHVLEILDGHPAQPARKLEAFALLGGLTALFVQSETAATGDAARHGAYLSHVAAAGHHPYIAALVAAASTEAQRSSTFAVVLAGALAAVLG